LVVYGTASDLSDGIIRASNAVDSGASAELLEEVARVSQSVDVNK